MNPRLTILAPLAALLLFTSTGVSAAPVPIVHFEVGSLIIPMDTDYQDEGMLEAFGLINVLLQHDIKVNWVIKQGKTFPDADFVASALDLESGAAITDHGYRGGPFVIGVDDALVATPLIEAWQAANVTTVHFATTSFDGPVRVTMVAAPRIAVFGDGNEDIAFGYLNAAGILDSNGEPWTDLSPGALTVDEIRGTTDTVHNDGALFDADGHPMFCELMSMHWGVNDREKPGGEALVAEVRSFLTFPTHFFAECQAVNAFENAQNGLFLTTAGFDISTDPAPISYLNSDYAFAQLDGGFQTVGGSERAYTLAAGSEYKDADIVMMTQTTNPLVGDTDLWMTGYLDAGCSIGEFTRCTQGVGKISYLGGHRYETKTPITANLNSQGTRLFLNSIFEADCVTDFGQPLVNLDKTVIYEGNDVFQFVITARNIGSSVAYDVSIEDTVAAGLTVLELSPGGSEAAGVVTWTLGNLGSNESYVAWVRVQGVAGATYQNVATLHYRAGTSPRDVTSNQVTVDAVGDSDGDGCSNLQESQMGTDPALRDSDGDGAEDCVDICPTLSNPLQNLDTDPGHCGACDGVCGLGEVCVNGSCGNVGDDFGPSDTQPGDTASDATNADDPNAADVPVSGDASTADTGRGSTPGVNSGGDESCGCHLARDSGVPGAWSLLALGAMLLFRRRRRG